MALLTLRNVRHGFGGPTLLEGVDLRIDAGERVCLIGRNGSGKSTLLRIIAGAIIADEGERTAREATRIATLTQEVSDDIAGSVFEVVAGGLGDQAALMNRFHRASAAGRLAELDRLQHELEVAGGWQIERRVATAISRLALPTDRHFAELSGGLKRRVLLARALVSEPQLLLLDEPTNHLDIEAIAWLEKFLGAFGGALIFVTHDRTLIHRLATRIVELDRGRLTSWPGDFDHYLRRKNEALAAEARAHRRADKKLAAEEIWVRQGVQARRTRNEGRARALTKLREQRRQRRARAGKVAFQIEAARESGRLVVTAEQISYAWQQAPIIERFSTTILRGDKVGLIGPNGCGKTTLLQLLLGTLTPHAGQVKRGTRLEIAYFDQLREQLDDARSVRDNLGTDTVTVGGRPKHVIAYLQDFLFSPQRANTPVKALSGGERNRLLLARLFARRTNVLVLDEPTNDLDMETLELLEARLVAYAGTVLLVSHDRSFLNNVVTSTLVFEDARRIHEYIGGYDDWLRQRPAVGEQTTAKKRPPPRDRHAHEKNAKLSYREQRELQDLPIRIEALEAEQAQMQAQMQEPAFYRQPAAQIAQAQARLQTVHEKLRSAYTRWEALEARG